VSVTGPVGRLKPERLNSTVRLAALTLTRRLADRAGPDWPRPARPGRGIGVP
jgi:hypothetical protein